jgi:hypothetical protein
LIISLISGAGWESHVDDNLEPRRPKVDAAVLAVALSETFTGVDFVIRSDGVVRLAPQLARRVCQLGFCQPEGSKSEPDGRLNSRRLHATSLAEID